MGGDIVGIGRIVGIGATVETAAGVGGGWDEATRFGTGVKAGFGLGVDGNLVGIGGTVEAAVGAGDCDGGAAVSVWEMPGVGATAVKAVEVG